MPVQAAAHQGGQGEPGRPAAGRRHHQGPRDFPAGPTWKRRQHVMLSGVRQGRPTGAGTQHRGVQSSTSPHADPWPPASPPPSCGARARTLRELPLWAPAPSPWMPLTAPPFPKGKGVDASVPPPVLLRPPLPCLTWCDMGLLLSRGESGAGNGRGCSCT